MAKFPMIIVNESLPLVIKMNPNPNSISIDRAKVYSKTQTLGGWVFEHWGEQPRTLKVKGRTHPVLGPNSPGQNQTVGVEAALLGLQQIYTLDKRPLFGLGSVLKDPSSIAKVLSGKDLNEFKVLSNTFIYYKLDLYTGFFTKFSYDQSGEQSPRHYEYEFEFLITGAAQSALANGIFSTIAAPLAGLAGSAVGTGLLSGTKITGIGGLNI